MRYFCILLFLIAANALKANTAVRSWYNLPIARLIADTDTVVKKRSIYAGVSYGSDALFFGRTGPIKYPFFSTDVIYNAKSGVFLYGSAVKVLGYQPLVDEIDLGAGYLYKYSKRFSGSISYTRFIFDPNAALIIKSSSSNDINFKNSFDWKIVKTSATLDYLFGNSSDLFLSVNLSRYFETNWSIFDDKDYLSFTPSLNLIMGTQNFVQKYSNEHPNKLVLNNIFLSGDYEPAERYNNGRFRSLNYSIKLPIAYNRPHYTFEASAKYSIPVNVEGVLKNRHEVFYNLTFYYVFY
jgi:hypothetical protein